jgi:hypothetical protein
MQGTALLRTVAVVACAFVASCKRPDRHYEVEVRLDPSIQIEAASDHCGEGNLVGQDSATTVACTRGESNGAVVDLRRRNAKGITTQVVLTLVPRESAPPRVTAYARTYEGMLEWEMSELRGVVTLSTGELVGPIVLSFELEGICSGSESGLCGAMAIDL